VDNTLVAFQTSILGEIFTALVAMEWFLSVVDSTPVAFQTSILGEIFTTLVAMEWLLSVVDSELVEFQIDSPAENLIADLAHQS